MRSIIRLIIPRDNFLFQFYYLLKAFAANLFYGFPARDMVCIGITGTDGKTTTTHMIYYLMREQALPVCMLSSSHFAIKDKFWINTTHKTTLDHFTIQKFLHDARKKGCKYACIETASHGIHQKRIWGIPYDIAVFTNLSHEHLDYHKNMDEYLKVKKSLFEITKFAKKKPGVTKTGIVNGDDPVAKSILEINLPHKYAILKDESKEFKLPQNTQIRKLCDINEEHMTWTVMHGEKRHKVRLSIPGLYNMENASLALCVAEELNLDYTKAIHDLELFGGVPGRMEIVKTERPCRIILDYAVTPNAFRLTLETLRKTTPGNLIHVFGSCGDRDKVKRPILGEISSKICDLPVITDEEPYTENPLTIMESVASGCTKTGREKINLLSRTGKFNLQKSYAFIPDRRDAIKFAISIANSPNDTVVITGMGDQTSKTIGTRHIPWSDRETVKEVAAEM